jgi:1,4-alpha-glucan branching enzyme
MTALRNRGDVAIVLHAHLPYVRASRDEERVEEQWLYEAMWESYLPLADVIERAAGGAPHPRLTLSLSPTLLSMLGDAHYRAGFDAFTGGLDEVCARAEKSPKLAPAVRDHRARLTASRARWTAARRDLTRSFVDLATAGAMDLVTTCATHAFLPAVLTPAAARAQLRLGRRYFRAVTGLNAEGLWLPECGYAEKLLDDVARSGTGYVVLEQHGLDLARPRPEGVPLSPIVSPNGVAFFGRAADLVGLVWSAAHGYPGDPAYREFHADVERLLPEALPAGWIGPTGIRPLRVTGSDGPKEPYDPEVAAARARSHACDFVRALDAAFASSSATAPLAVLAFDAELFGHWWYEGPLFLESLLALLGERAVSLSEYLARDPELSVAEPATSSWGEGGFAGVWTHPRAAHAVRVGHRAERRVLYVDSIVRDTPRAPVQREARLWAIRELLQLEASDYPFLLSLGESTDFAEARLREHAQNVDRLTLVASRKTPEPGDADIVREVRERRPLFAELDEDALADALDPFE